MPAPTVLISYAHEDDDGATLRRVRALADRMKARGIDVQLDQDQQGPPAEGWPRWMMRQIEGCDVVLCLCTPTWRRRFEGREDGDRGRGVTFEGLLLLQDLYDSWMRNRRILPLIWDGGQYEDVPKALRPWVHWRLPRDEEAVIAYCLRCG